MITILTPTYNRENLLQRLADSLLMQTCYDFEWLVVDDGSDDNTKAFIKKLADGSPFSIRYVYKENGGKHTALNLGFVEADCEWVFMVDSDDWLDKYCINEINTVISSLDDDTGSISILKSCPNGKVVGDYFPDDIQSYIDRIEKGVKGDKGDIIRKSAINGFHFPVFDNEKFMPESPFFIYLGVKWKTKFINYAGYFCEYQSDGLSAFSVINRHKCYNSALYVYHYQYKNMRSFSLRVRACVNWWRFRSGKKNVQFKGSVPLIYAFIGVLFAIRDAVKFGFSCVVK